MARVFSSLRDITGWYVCASTRTVIFNRGEVDHDAKVTHISREEDHNEHMGRLFMQRERASKKRKVTTMPARSVGVGSAGPPEANLEIGQTIRESMKLGSVAGADGGRAILSQVKVAAAKAAGRNDAIPVVQAIHGKRPRKQFTRLDKVDKASIPAELEAVLREQGRWDEASKTVRFIGGNQAAESEWGVSGQLLAQKAVHRGNAKLHSTAHACSALFPGVCPGLKNLSHAMQRFFQDCMDKADPSAYFTRSGWTAAGAPADDMDAQRVCATDSAKKADKA